MQDQTLDCLRFKDWAIAVLREANRDFMDRAALLAQ
jgi:hypothetical protein